MTYKVDRSLGGIYSSQLSTQDVKSSPMLRGRAKGGPKDNIILEASYSWDGIVNHYIESRRTKIYGPYPGRYTWNGKTWVWREDEDGNKLNKEAQDQS